MLQSRLLGLFRIATYSRALVNNPNCVFIRVHAEEWKQWQAHCPLFKCSRTYISGVDVGDRVLLGTIAGSRDEGHGAEAQSNHGSGSKDLLSKDTGEGLAPCKSEEEWNRTMDRRCPGL